ncbi:DNA-dependent metalloprotease SPRTN isoform X2 [Spea bombifrons]|uniref:DNA-dependent metalloprotease SPRTN isoform X2 n=1 Tax=Spea bombifrons TaxID=233779 RepID=UPI00234AFA9A|nr:DNA-dependent metalloprotease SPRTN isoform X2 [Spea bombifrons]
MAEDFLLALRLQEEYDRELAGPSWEVYEDDSPEIIHTVSRKSATPAALSTSSKAMSVVDPSWELLDPIPDIRALFLQFNDMFFWGKLAGVEVKWSARMTLCAGVCSYEGRGGLCSIRLSEPLLKLRPRKDLVETLLHEMIHALLFVTHNNKDHDSHGPEFCKHMTRINSLTGSNISVYHNFHDEVDEYRKHWWLCNGPCKTRKPYFGYVKRAMNRAPSSLDPWWSEHQRTCGGTFLKVKEPENYGQKGKRKNESSHSQPTKPSDVKDKSNLKGVDIRTVIPFSGVGYKLVESTNSAVPPKVQSIKNTSTDGNKSSPHRSSISTITTREPSIPNQVKNNTNSKATVPKISVANTKAFISVDGSPIKLMGNGNKPVQNVSTHDFFFSNKKQKKISFAIPSSSTSFPSASQGSNHDEGHVQPTKRPRMNDKKTLDDFFMKTSRNNTTNGGVMPNVNNATGSTSIMTSSSNSQSMKVSCPICRTEVLEVKINDHLDACLAAC